MKSIIKPLLCALAVFTGIFINTLIYGEIVNTEMYVMFGLLSFLFGFIPGYCLQTLDNLKGCDIESVAVEPQPEIYVYVGKTYTSLGANCGLRVKSVKSVMQVLEYHNELIADYM